MLVFHVVLSEIDDISRQFNLTIAKKVDLVTL